jgi:hypothetical protein
MKEEEITRTEASFLGGIKLERGRHSGSSPDSHLASLSLFSKDMWAVLASPWTCSNYPCLENEGGEGIYRL